MVKDVRKVSSVFRLENNSKLYEAADLKEYCPSV